MPNCDQGIRGSKLEAKIDPKSIKKCNTRWNAYWHIGIDWFTILAGFGCQVGVENPPNIDPKNRCSNVFDRFLKTLFSHHRCDQFPKNALSRELSNNHDKWSRTPAELEQKSIKTHIRREMHSQTDFWMIFDPKMLAPGLQKPLTDASNKRVRF